MADKFPSRSVKIARMVKTQAGYNPQDGKRRCELDSVLFCLAC